MSYQRVKAGLNLHAVLKNLEDLVQYDSEVAAMVKNWDVSVQFVVNPGMKGYVSFKDGACAVGKGKCDKPSIVLFFISPAHFNKTLDGDGTPIPLKGFSRLKFLLNDFPKVTEKLEYYLKPTEELLEDSDYLELNTRLTLNTAVFGASVLGMLDPDCITLASHIKDGKVLMTIQPDGPSAHLNFSEGGIEPGKGAVDEPSAIMSLKDTKVANDFFNGKSDAFTAIASGDVSIMGQVPMLDALGLILDRIPKYLS